MLNIYLLYNVRLRIDSYFILVTYKTCDRKPGPFRTRCDYPWLWRSFKRIEKHENLHRSLLLSLSSHVSRPHTGCTWHRTTNFVTRSDFTTHMCKGYDRSVLLGLSHQVPVISKELKIQASKSFQWYPIDSMRQYKIQISSYIVPSNIASCIKLRENLGKISFVYTTYTGKITIL